MNTESIGILCAFLSSCTWAIGTAHYSKVSDQHSGFDINYTRAWMGLPLFILSVFLISKGNFQDFLSSFQTLKMHHFIWFSISMFASYGFGDILFFRSSQSIGVPSALAISSSFPLLTTFAGVFIEGKSVSLYQVLGLLIALSGISLVILSAPQQDQKLKKTKPLKGFLLAGLACAFWALNAWALSKAGSDISPFVGNTFRMVLAILLSFMIGVMIEKRRVRLLPKTTLRKHAWAFAIEVFLGSLFFLYGLSHAPLVLGTLLTSLAPVLVVPVALLMKMEKFSLKRFTGVALTLCGLAFIGLS